jgi:hypothetical protein
MTVSRALTAYNKSLQVPFANTPGVKLVAPSVTNAGSGFTWLSQFIGNATQLGYQIDVINIHWYASPYNMEYFISYMTEAHTRWPNYPIWITEYGMDNTNYYEPHVLQFIRNTTTWCDAQPWIERYAWFGNYPNNLINAQSTALSPRGELWNSYANSSYVYGYPARLAPAGSVEEAKKVKLLDQEVGGSSPEEIGASAEAEDESGWSRGFFPEKLWWKQDGQMDGKE